MKCRLLVAALVSLNLVMISSGCSLSDQKCLVSGQVTIDSQLVDGVYLLFHQEHSSDVVGTARTDPSGYYLAKLPVAGRYAVTAFWPRVIRNAEETIEGEDRLGGKYRDSLNPLTFITVSNGENYPPAINISSR